MAEVLITLGIIGVVAAMTLPSVINNIQNKELETQFKKSYSVISQALLLMKNEEGCELNSENFTSANEFMIAFKKYFLKYNDCNGKSKCDSITISRLQEYKTFNSSGTIDAGFIDDTNAFIGSGMNIYTNGIWGNGLIMTVDINGINKRPNKWGHDLFSFQIINSKLVPVGMNGTQVYADKELTPEKYCSINLSSNLNGFTCSARAFSEKDYFKNLPR